MKSQSHMIWFLAIPVRATVVCQSKLASQMCISIMPLSFLLLVGSVGEQA
jgi:hypothetical protein